LILFDTSVVLDARDPDSPFHAWARNKIAEAAAGDGAAVNTIVISESSVRSKTPEAVPGIMQAMGLTLVPLPISAAVPAAKAFATYLDRLKKEGKTSIARSPLPDFFIGAHAHAESLQLVTRDPDRIRTYFPTVKLVTP
jgi:predicted nucleic acid-binding protein